MTVKRWMMVLCAVFVLGLGAVFASNSFISEQVYTAVTMPQLLDSLRAKYEYGLKSVVDVQAQNLAEQARERAENARRDGMLAAANQLEEVVGVLSSASDELHSRIKRSRRGAADSAGRLEQTVTAMEEMNSTVLEVAKNAADASAISGQTRSKAEQGAEVVRQAVDGIRRVQEQSLALRGDMTALGEQARNIGRILGVISDIADQTNLLALNAAIEAATTDVGNAIHGIQASAEKSVTEVDAAARMVEEATGHATLSGQALEEIVSLADRTADQVQAIATASEEQSASSGEINRSLSEVNALTGETADSMDEAARAVAELARQTQVLTGLIEDMKRG